MSNYNSIKAIINANVKTNGKQEISGSVLNSVLNAMVNALGAGYQYAGVATPDSNPGTPDTNVVYIAATAGTYAYMGGLAVAEGEVAILRYNGTWTKDVTGAATAKEMFGINRDIYGRTVPKTDLPTRNGSMGNSGNVNAVVWLNIPCAGYDYIHFRINKPFAAAGNIYVFSYTLPNGSYHDKVDDDIANGFYQDDINKELTLSVKGLNSFTIQCYETSLPFSYPSSCTPVRVASFASGEGLEYYLTKDNTLISQLRTEVNHIADFTIVNQNNSNLPNFDESTQTLDFGEDPVFCCRGKRYVPAQIWASDESKYRAIRWPSPDDDEVGPALILVFNADDCTFAFKRYSAALASAECIVGGLRTSRTSKHVIAHMPFQFTINGISAETEVSKLARISKTTSFILINQNSSTLPNFDDTNKQLDFGSDPVIFCKGQKYQPAVIWSSDTSKFRAIPWILSVTTAQILVFKTSDCTFFFKAYFYSPADDEVIIGGIRLNPNNTMRVANVPFLYTINGKNLWLEWNSIIPSFQGRRVSIIPTGISAISLPNLDTATRTLSFGADTGIEIGGESHIGTANLSVTIPSNGTTAFRIWFDLDSKTLSATEYKRTYPTNSRKVLLGSIRWATDGSIYADLPFDITFNGGNAGRLYRSYSDTPHYYSGEKIVIGGTLRLRKQIDYTSYGTLSHSGGQGLAIYNEQYLVRLYNGGGIAIFDLTAQTKLGEFDLASAGSENHANCLNFGKKFDSSDTLPLMYISEAYGQNRLFVERVNGNFSSSSLIQTISFSGVLPSSHNGNSFAVDVLGNRLFMVIHLPDHNVMVKVFDLPSISNASVTLTSDDVLDSYTIEGIENIMQGVTYQGGKLLMPFGFGTSAYPSSFAAIDTDKKRLSTFADISFLSGEMEDVTTADNAVVIGNSANKLYYLDF